MTPVLALAAAGLGLQLDLTWPPLSPAHVAPIFRSLYSSSRVAPGSTQVVADLGLYLLKGPIASSSGGQLQTM